MEELLYLLVLVKFVEKLVVASVVHPRSKLVVVLVLLEEHSVEVLLLLVVRLPEAVEELIQLALVELCQSRSQLEEILV